jgi:hypothetical protein
VSFDGTGDSLQNTSSSFWSASDDCTFECFIYPTTYSVGQGIFHTGNQGDFSLLTDGKLRVHPVASHYKDTNGIVPLNTWSHIALVQSSSNQRKVFINGVNQSFSSSGSPDSNGWNNPDGGAFIGDDGVYRNFFNGSMSNVRVLKGTALYTSNFTPPVHALETINGTRILCCNNPDSVTAASNAGIGTAHVLTANGDPTVATDNPSLTRDFTSGTEFKGVTTFDTQGYFVPPSGTTEQRGRGRGFFVGGNNPTYFSNIDTVQISSQGNAIRFGDLSVARAQTYGAANSTRGVVFGSYDGSNNGNLLEAFDTTTGADTIDFGNLLSSTARRGVLGMASNTRAIAAGGATPSRDNTIQYVTIASLGDAQEFGDLIADSSHASAATACSPTRGVMGGGTKLVSGSTNSIGYITMATTGNSVDFGDALSTSTGPSGVMSSSTRGVFFHATPTATEFITISSLGNGQEFGDLGTGTGGAAAVTNSVRGLNAGAFISPANVNTITFVNIASTGDGTDFGDLIRVISSVGGYSDSHGGLS